MHILRPYFDLIFCLLFVFLFVFFIPSRVEAAFLKFDKTTTTVAVGSTFTLDVMVDAGSDQITSTDMWVVYDPTLLEVQTVSSGTFFPSVANNVAAGKVYVAGLINETAAYKTGIGTVGTITFKGLKDGTATIAYDCRADVANSSKVIKNAVDPTNVIVCSQNISAVATVGVGGTAVVPTSAGTIPTSAYNSQTNPTALPQSGIMDEMPKLLIAGSLFVIFGVAMRVLLLL